MTAPNQKPQFSLKDTDTKSRKGSKAGQTSEFGAEVSEPSWIKRAVSHGLNFVRETTGIGVIPAIDLDNSAASKPQIPAPPPNQTPIKSQAYQPTWSSGPDNRNQPSSDTQRPNQNSSDFASQPEFTRFSRVMKTYKQEEQQRQQQQQQQKRRRPTQSYYIDSGPRSTPLVIKLIILAALGLGGLAGYRYGRTWLASSNGNFARFIKEKMQGSDQSKAKATSPINKASDPATRRRIPKLK